VLRTGLGTDSLEGGFRGTFEGPFGKHEYRGRAAGVVLPLRTPEFREKAETYLSKTGFLALTSAWKFCDPHSHMIYAPGSPHTNGLYGGAGLASLALWGIRAPEPVCPPPPDRPKAPNPADYPPFLRAQLPSEDALLKQHEEQVAAARKAWEYAHALWKASGGMNVRYYQFETQAHRSLGIGCLYAMGEGGFQGSGDSTTLTWNQILDSYAVAYRNVFGLDVTGRHDISHFVPRYVMTTVWREGKPFSQGFGAEPATPGAGYLSKALPLCPPAWRPAVFWYWLKWLGLSPEEAVTAGGAAKLVACAGNDPIALINTFIHFPVDPAGGALALEPKNPAAVMPRVWEAKTRGFLLFPQCLGGLGRCRRPDRGAPGARRRLGIGGGGGYPDLRIGRGLDGEGVRRKPHVSRDE
jgi:hypothetical protein